MDKITYLPLSSAAPTVVSPPEAFCRYLAGLRRPNERYFEEVVRWLDRVCDTPCGTGLADFLERVTPAHLRRRPRRSGRHATRRTETVGWQLTPLGMEAVFGPEGCERRSRRLPEQLGRRVLLALALLEAVPSSEAVEEVRDVLLDTEMAFYLGRYFGYSLVYDFTEEIQARSDTSPLCADNETIIEVVRTLRSWRVGEFEEEGRGTAAYRIPRSLASLEKAGLVTRSTRELVEPPAPAVVTSGHVENLKRLHQKGTVQLSPLAEALLSRRLSRRTVPTQRVVTMIEREESPGQAVLGAHFRHLAGLDVAAVAEQVTLRHERQFLAPISRTGWRVPPPETLVTRRADMVLWSPEDRASWPSHLVEMEASTVHPNWLANHIETGLAVSMLARRPVRLDLVARSTVRDEVAYLLGSYQFWTPGVWPRADVTVRVRQLGSARRKGLGPEGLVVRERRFQGPSTSAREEIPEHPSTPFSFLQDRRAR